MENIEKDKNRPIVIFNHSSVNAPVMVGDGVQATINNEGTMSGVDIVQHGDTVTSQDPKPSAGPQAAGEPKPSAEPKSPTETAPQPQPLKVKLNIGKKASFEDASFTAGESDVNLEEGARSKGLSVGGSTEASSRLKKVLLIATPLIALLVPFVTYGLPRLFGAPAATATAVFGSQSVIASAPTVSSTASRTAPVASASSSSSSAPSPSAKPPRKPLRKHP